MRSHQEVTSGQPWTQMDAQKDSDGYTFGNMDIQDQTLKSTSWCVVSSVCHCGKVTSGFGATPSACGKGGGELP